LFSGGDGKRPIAAAKNCLELLEDKLANTSIGTNCKALDVLLGGGLQIGEITELCEPALSAIKSPL